MIVGIGTLFLIIGLIYYLINKSGSKKENSYNKKTYYDIGENKYHNDDSYQNLLLDNRWREKRLKILDRDNNMCRHCGLGYNLQVHHKYYSKYPNNKFVDPWSYPDDALITLCENCHKNIHRAKKIKVYYRKYGR